LEGKLEFTMVYCPCSLNLKRENDTTAVLLICAVVETRESRDGFLLF